MNLCNELKARDTRLASDSTALRVLDGIDEARTATARDATAGAPRDGRGRVPSGCRHQMPLTRRWATDLAWPTRSTSRGYRHGVYPDSKHNEADEQKHTHSPVTRGTVAAPPGHERHGEEHGEPDHTQQFQPPHIDDDAPPV